MATGPFVLKFEVAGDVQIARGFSRFADDVKDLREAFKEIVKDFREGERKQFESEGGYGSGGWRPLAVTTLIRKERAGYPPNILQRTRRLMESLTGGAEAITKISKLELVMGTSVPYARRHQEGTSVMPARPVIELAEEQKQRWSKIIHRWLVKKATERGLR